MDAQTDVPASAMRILLLGCGKMGSAMLDAWLSHSLISQALVIDPSGLPERFQNDTRITWAPGLNETPGIKSDVFVIATKPQALNESLEEINLSNSKKTVFLSIAAGKTIDALAQIIGNHHAIVRTMPNTPAAIGKGMSVAVANAHCSAPQRGMVNRLLGATGLIRWVEDEALIDSVTALSGSGPAYVFLLIEILAQSGEKLGLPSDLAQTLARQTVIGSAALAEARHDISAAQLRQNVTSPGGTTQAALERLMDGDLQCLFDEALLLAAERAKALNN